MATQPAAKTTTTDKPKRTPPTLVERTKSQLSTAALRGKIKAEELDALASHIDKLKALLA
jgi:hypothetical protein